jgi:hypothetical protein
MDIGFYAIDMDYSEKNNDIVKAMNDIVENDIYSNVILFNNTYNRADGNKKFPIINFNQAKYFKGILISFDLRSAAITRTFPSPIKQFFVVDELPWINNTKAPVSFWNSIYNNQYIDLIVNNQENFDLLEICWKKPVKVLEKIEAKGILDVIKTL